MDCCLQESVDSTRKCNSTAAVSLGISALFWEVHPDPDKAKCDGPNQLKLSEVQELLERIVELDRWAKG